MSKRGMPPADAAMPVVAIAASGGASANVLPLKGDSPWSLPRVPPGRPPSARPWPVPWQWAWTGASAADVLPVGRVASTSPSSVAARSPGPTCAAGTPALAVRRREEELVLALGGGGAGRARAGTEHPHERENASDDPLRLPHVVDAPLVVPVCGNTLGALEERKPLTLVPNAPARFNLLPIVVLPPPVVPPSPLTSHCRDRPLQVRCSRCGRPLTCGSCVSSSPLPKSCTSAHRRAASHHALARQSEPPAARAQGWRRARSPHQSPRQADLVRRAIRARPPPGHRSARRRPRAVERGHTQARGNAAARLAEWASRRPAPGRDHPNVRDAVRAVQGRGRADALGRPVPALA